MTHETNPESSVPANVKPSRFRLTATEAAVVAIIFVAAAGSLTSAAKSYIDARVAQTLAQSSAKQIVPNQVLDERIDARARAVAIDAIRTSPALVAETLNRYIAQQQEDVQRKDDDAVRALLPQMADAKDVPVLGARNAKLTVVYFFDANCPYCRQMDPILRPLTMEGSGIRVIYREIPILGPASERAARFSSAVWKTFPDKWNAFHEAMMAAKGQADDAAIDRIAIASLGVDDARTVAIAAARDDAGGITDPVKTSLDLARRAGIKGTPFTLIGDKTILRGATPREQFAEAVMKALTGEK